MRLIGLAVVFTLSLIAAPLAAEAQQPGKVYRIGILSGGLPDMNSPHMEAFRRGLRETGWVEGRDVVIEWRSAEGKTDRLNALAADLAHVKVDVIVTAGSTPATVAAKRATSTIPIVMIAVGSAVDTGLVLSLARPGANVTGSTTLGAEVATKRLQFVKDLLPGAVRIALLWNPANPSNARLYMDLRQKVEQEHAAGRRDCPRSVREPLLGCVPMDPRSVPGENPVTPRLSALCRREKQGKRGKQGKRREG